MLSFLLHVFFAIYYASAFDRMEDYCKHCIVTDCECVKAGREWEYIYCGNETTELIAFPHLPNNQTSECLAPQNFNETVAIHIHGLFDAVYPRFIMLPKGIIVTQFVLTVRSNGIRYTVRYARYDRFWNFEQDAFAAFVELPY